MANKANNKKASFEELARRNQEMMDRRMGRTPAGWCGKASGLPTDTNWSYRSKYFEAGKRERGCTDRIMGMIGGKVSRDNHNKNLIK